jgi:hypothetical protein
VNAAEVRAVPGCGGCSRGWVHCHGTWVLHTDGTGECTDGEHCPVPAEGHEAVLDCWEVDSRCCAYLRRDASSSPGT